MENLYEAITNFFDEKNIQPGDMFIERYVTDPRNHAGGRAGDRGGSSRSRGQDEQLRALLLQPRTDCPLVGLATPVEDALPAGASGGNPAALERLQFRSGSAGGRHRLDTLVFLLRPRAITSRPGYSNDADGRETAPRRCVPYRFTGVSLDFRRDLAPSFRPLSQEM